MWTPGQLRQFAKDFIAGPLQGGRAGKYLTSDMRVALVGEFCFNICRSQMDRGGESARISVAEMDALLFGVRAAVEAKLHTGYFDP